MNILDQIVAARRRTFQSYAFPPRSVPLVPFFRPKPFLITEFKRSSPTQKKISTCSHAELAQDYYAAGIRNFSVLTEQNFFDGTLRDLYELKQKYPHCAFLRKDFLSCRADITQAYQAGADAVLLIAEILSDQLLQELINAAHKYKLQVLGEAYSLPSLQRMLRLKNPPDAIGINSRDLKTFRIQPDQPLRLKPYIPQNIPVVYESGVDNDYLLEIIGNAGFRAALIGEAAVKAANRKQTVKNFAHALRRGAEQKPNFFTKLYAQPKNIYVKMCGLTSPADVELAAKSGADVAGFVFVPGSPRRAAAKLLRAVKPVRILKAAVVKKVTPQIKKLLRLGLIDAVQTYTEADIYALAGNAYFVAVDPRRRALPITLYDAPKTKSMRQGRPIPAREHQHIYGQWLAGGLTPQNVRGLIRKIRPGLVDVSSGIEKSIGQKDARKIKLFLQEVARA
ncbi:indole-3-glycerol phosphate synthase [Candidatus Termititenax persephonae]|uniref:N-(5'-phosphoribosyl)anthranilate isomerase n=1 Tax=Candidatus Termititenax persephonae TaxID=2218525 RepID=A0A388TG34_9BACT|nr:indole-3-glycerol phosphate synthase [Candidatus Termititenax persephonae]